jgi:hypothetical protein
LRLERQLFGNWLRLITSGWGDAGNAQRFEETMAEVDGALKRFGGPYFLGKEVRTQMVRLLNSDILKTEVLSGFSHYSRSFEEMMAEVD